jgi:hypothetical protein
MKASLEFNRPHGTDPKRLLSSEWKRSSPAWHVSKVYRKGGDVQCTFHPNMAWRYCDGCIRIGSERGDLQMMSMGYRGRSLAYSISFHCDYPLYEQIIVLDRGS